MSLLAALRAAGAISAMDKILQDQQPRSPVETERALNRLLAATQNAIAARRSGDDEWLADAAKDLDRALEELERVRGKS